MSENTFFDSNVLIYACTQIPEEYLKTERVLLLLKAVRKSSTLFLSTQVLGETYYVLSKKYKLPNKQIEEKIKNLLPWVTLKQITLETIMRCWELRNQYHYSYYDSLVLASALENGCQTVYSEDMQHSQLIEGKLKIINPFIDLK